MADRDRPERMSWIGRFRCAGRGVARAVRTQANFAIHITTAAAVVVAAIALGASLVEWCVLIVCMAVVLAAEMFNTAIEHLARAVTQEPNEHVRDALDVAAGAVLTAAVGAAIAGSLIFVRRLLEG